MKLFIKNFIKKDNIRLYIFLLFLILIIMMYSLITINYLEKYDYDNLNRQDNLKIELINSYNINIFNDLKDKIEYVYLNDMFDNYYIFIDINDKHNLKNNELILTGPKLIEFNNFIVKNYIKEENKKIIISDIFLKDNEYLFTIVANDYNSKLDIISHLSNLNIKANDITTYESNNASQIYRIVFWVLSLFLILIIITIIYIYNKDDRKFNNLLCIIGYNKIKLLFLNFFVFLILLSFLFILCSFIIFVVSFLLNYKLNYYKCINDFIVLFLVLNLIFYLIYLIFYLVNYKKIVIKQGL